MKRTVKGFVDPKAPEFLWSRQYPKMFPATLTWDDGKPAPKRKRKRLWAPECKAIGCTRRTAIDHGFCFQHTDMARKRKLSGRGR